MKKRILTLMLLLLTATFVAEANPVDMRTVREVAVKFMKANSEVPLRGTDDLRLVKTYNISRGDAAFYVFNTPNGFVIVSADDCVTPILGYSNEGQFDVENIPIQLQDYLQGFVEQISYNKENHLEADEATVQRWSMVRTTGRLTNNRPDEVVGPLVTALWDQTCYYNSKCPEDPHGYCGHVLVGCVATSMSQVMHYWGYPEHGTGSYSYTPSGYPEQSVDFGATTYDWANMPNSLSSSSTSEQVDAVSTLMWHCGVSVSMHYGPHFSGSWLSPSSLINYFNYSDEMKYEQRNDYSDATWKAKLRDCLDRQRPMWYDGSPSGSGSPHAFVCDGYDNNDMFHFNWGWGGSSDGFFTIDDNLYGRNNGAVLNIHPQSDTPTVYDINISANNNVYGSVFGSGSYIHGDTVTLSAIANNGYCFHYWEENGGIASMDPNFSFPANFNRDLTAVFTEPVTISVSAMEGGTVSGGGLFCYEECEVIAIPNDGFEFAYWSVNDHVVSIDADYIFIVTGETHLTAHFNVEENIVFADTIVKAICLDNWDYNGDGELSLAEAAGVTGLAQVFKNKTNITSFDELQYFTSLTMIGDNEFGSCSNLTSLILPNAITSIGNSAFSGCTRLISLTIPNSVTLIGNYAFRNCSGLTSLTLPNSLTSIGSYAFYNCSGWTGSLSLPSSLASIGEYAFYNCSGLSGSLTFPNSITTISTYAFNGCRSLAALIIPNTVTSIGISAFSGCSGLTTLTIPNAITSISSNAFRGCSGLTSLTISNSVTTIGTYAFSGCSGLTSLTLPNAVVSIGNYAFSGCSGLATLTIPDSVESIGSYAFSGCSGLASIIVLAETPPTIENNSFNSVYNIPLYVPCQSVGVYGSTNYWRSFSSITGLCASGTITLVADQTENGEVTGGGTYESGTLCTVTATPNEGYCFINWTENGNVVSTDASYNFVVTSDRQLTAHFALDGIIVFADANVKAICLDRWDTSGDGELSYAEAARVINIAQIFRGHTEITSFDELQYFVNLSPINEYAYAFSGCTGLTSLAFPNSVTTIGEYAFYNCSGLTELPLTNSITTIRDYAFSGCTGLTSLTLPNSIITIGNYAFNGCSGFTGDLFIPDSVTSIGNYAFSDCNGFTSITLGNSITSIGNYAFSGCNGLSGDLNIPNSVTSIGNYAFSGCSGFTGSLNIGNSVTSIGNYAFNNCNGFTGDLNIPDSVTSIGNYAFSGCTGFTGSLNIGNSVTSIGNYAFNNCHGFTGDLNIPNSVIYIREYAFRGCYGFTGNLSIGNSVTSIGNYAFYNCYGFTGDLSIPNSVTSIGNYAFYQCYGFTGNLNLGNSVRSIGNNAFYYCQGFTGGLTIPNSVISIGECAFCGFIDLRGSLTIGSAVTSIGNYAFSSTNHLCSIIVQAQQPPTLGTRTFSDQLTNNIPLYVPCESVESYQTTAGWNAFSNTIGMCSSGLVTVAADPAEGGSVSGGGTYEGGATCTIVATPNEGFYFANWTANGTVVSCDSIYSFVVTGDCVMTAHFVIGGNIVFADANVKAICVDNWDTNGDGELSYVEAASITTIGSVFSGNAEITSFEELQYFIGLTTISNNAFYNCQNLTSLVIPNAVTLIGSSAFEYCYNLTGPLTIPNTVTSIGSYAFSYCYGLTGSLTIPNSVTSIGYRAFQSCHGFTGSLTIGNSVTSIGEYAFYYCYGLTGSLTIPNSVTSIGEYAFYNCYGLTGSLTIGNAVTSIGSSAFSSCRGLTLLTIGNAVSSIGSYAFSNCNGLNSMIALSETPPTVGTNAFNQVPTNVLVYVPCESVETYQTATGWSAFPNIMGMCSPGAVTVAADPVEGGTVTGSGTFEGGTFCTVIATPNEGYCFANWTRDGGLVSNDSIYSFVVTGESAMTAHFVLDGNIVFADANVKAICVDNWDTNGDGELSYLEAARITSLGEVFSYNGEITSFEELQYFIGLSSIGNNAFYGCSSLRGSLIIPSSVTSIGNNAFRDCGGLTGSLIIPDYVTSIGNSAFSSCLGLTSMTIGNAVASIGNSAFSNCNGLNSMIALSEMPPTVGTNVFYQVPTDIPMYVPCESAEAYQSAAGWEAFTNIIGMCSSGAVTVAADPVEGGTVSGAGTFDGGTLCTVTATPNEGYCFANWTKDGSVVSFNSTYSFIVTGESAMVAHFVPDGNIVFADDTVKALCVQNWDTNSDGELSYHEAARITSLGGIFSYNTEITSFEELQYFIGLSSIEDYAFSDCSSLTGSLILPNSINSIGYGAFENCGGLTGLLTIPNSVISIDSYAFYNCSGLTGSLTIPNSVTSIGYRAFNDCYGLSGSLTIGNFVTSIGSYAFEDCNGLTSLTLGNSVTSIGSNAFWYCTGLTSMVALSEMPPTVGSDAFYRVSANIPVFVPCESAETYQMATGWDTFQNIIGMCSSGTVSVAADPIEGGTVTGAGTYEGGSFCTVIATPNEGYCFVSWTENGRLVSSESNYSFVVTGESTMIAHFVPEGNIVFADDTVKALCVQNWDTNGDGELSYLEAASVTSLGYVFESNTEITSFEELQYFIGLTSIGSYAFYNCSSLTGALNIPSSVTSIGSYAFYNCSGLRYQLTLPNFLTSIGSYAFNNCYGLTGSLTIPNTVTSIGSSAFGNCSGLTGSLTIGNSVTYIGSYAFSGCHGFTSLTLGSSVTSIEYYAFSSCNGLESMIVLPELPPTVWYGAFNQVATNIPVYVPCESAETYQSASGWGTFTNIIGMCSPGTVSVAADPVEGGTVIGGGTYEGGAFCNVIATPNEGYCFVNWTKNGSVVSSESNYSFVVTGESAMTARFVLDGNIVFADANVKAICVENWDTNGDGELSYLEAAWVSSLGEVFKSNTEITSFDELQYFIGLSSISNYAFQGCTGLTSLTLPNYLTSIGNFAFYYCIGLTGTLTIPNSVTSIGNYAFYYCTGLTSMTLPNFLTSIGNSAFNYCTGLTGSLTIPDTVTSIGNSVFYNCSGFTGTLTLSNSVTSIGDSAFSGCIGLTGSLTIPDSVTSIGNSAFYSCRGLTLLTIGNAVSSIGSYAFSYCNGLNSMVVLPETPPTVESNAFYQVPIDIPVYVPCESVEAYQSAAVWNAFPNIVGMCSSGTITVVAEPVEGGTVSGAGTYEGGSSCTVIATPNEGYCFADWMENGYVVSCNSTYSFIVTGESVLTARFVPDGNIVFADANVKAICVDHWDTNGDGELSYLEAASVRSLGTVFTDNTEITSFEELQYFIKLTSIGYNAFRNCSSLTGSLILPSSITSIGNYAFYNCSGLTGSLIIPNSVTSIGNDAFYNCQGFNGTLTLPDSLTSISSYAFRNCSSLTGSLIIPNTVTSIGSSAFYNCYGFTGSLNIPNSVTSIGYGAFQNCSGLTGSLTIPNSVTSIGSSAFYNCYGLTGSLTLPDSLTSIESTVFSGCYGLTGSLTIPNSVTSIGSDAFYNCRGLSGSLTIPNSVTSIGNSAFYNCRGLTLLTIGNAVTSIGNFAFSRCDGLNSMIALSEMPPTVGSNAFYNVATDIPVYVLCESVEAYQSATGWDAFLNIIGMCSPGTITVVAEPVGGGSVSGAGTYESGTSCTVIATPNVGYFFANWTENGYVVSYNPTYSFIVTGESVLTAHFVTEGNIVFADANVKAICVDNWDTNGDGELSYVEAASVMSLGEVFRGHTEITSFEELQYFISLTSIGAFAFNGCSGLTGSLMIPNSVISIGERAFYGCSGLTGSLTIPNSVTSIDSYAFYGCSGFTGSLTISNSITSISNYAFYNCRGLTGSLTIPNSVTSIGGSAFSGCYGMTGSLTIPNSVTSIGSSAFSGCRGLTGSLTIPGSVTSIGSSAFYNCSGLTGSLTIPSSVTSIESSVFSGCSGLTGSLTIPNSVTSLGNSAFYNCSGLTGSLTISNSMTSIGNYTFYNCSGLTSLIVGRAVTSIGSYAFYNCTGLSSMAIYAATPPSLGYSSFSGVSRAIPVNVPCGSAEAYQSATYWNLFTNIQEICSQQTVTLFQGTNWVSFNVEITLDDLKAALVEALGNTSIVIVSQDNGQAIWNGRLWTGQLRTLDLTRMYKITVPADCEITLEAIPINPADYPVTIKSGINWIGFPFSESMPIATAFGDFATRLDVVKSQDSGQATWNGQLWTGQLKNLEPGKGYIYQSAATESRTFTFPTGAK